MKTQHIAILVALALISLVVGFFLGGGLQVKPQADATLSSVSQATKGVKYSREAKLELLNLSYKQMNEFIKVPSKLDPITTLEKVEKDEQALEVVYFYTISGMSAEELRAKQTIIRDQTIATVCNIPSSKALIDAGIGMRWKYYTENNEHVFENELRKSCN